MKQQQLTLASFGQLPIGTVTAMLTLTVLVICGCLQVEGGCSRFGHSCFGAHGKRAGPGFSPYGSAETVGAGYPGRIIAEFEKRQNSYEGAGENNNYPPSYYNNIPNYGAKLSPYFIDWLMSGGAGLQGPVASGTGSTELGKATLTQNAGAGGNGPEMRKK